jgi:hypothetical protein
MLDSGWNHAGMTTKDPLNEYRKSIPDTSPIPSLRRRGKGLKCISPLLRKEGWGEVTTPMPLFEPHCP